MRGINLFFCTSFFPDVLPHLLVVIYSMKACGECHMHVRDREEPAASPVWSRRRLATPCADPTVPKSLSRLDSIAAAASSQNPRALNGAQVMYMRAVMSSISARVCLLLQTNQRLTFASSTTTPKDPSSSQRTRQDSTASRFFQTQTLRLNRVGAR